MHLEKVWEEYLKSAACQILLAGNLLDLELGG